MEVSYYWISITIHYFRTLNTVALFRFHLSNSSALEAGKSPVRFPVGSSELFMGSILSATLWTGVDSASNRNEYDGYLPEVKAASA